MDGYLPKAFLQVISTYLSQKFFSLDTRNVNIYNDLLETRCQIFYETCCVPFFIEEILKMEAAASRENLYLI